MATQTESPLAPTSVGAIRARLLAKYGEVMLLADVAGELKTSSNALRIALHRTAGILPRPADLPGRGHRFFTSEFAAWLGGHAAALAPVDHAAAPRRPGRPRGPRRIAE